MKIFIDNIIEDGQDKGELYIECWDEKNIEVNIYRINDKGNVTVKQCGYYRNRNQALQTCLKMLIHNTTASAIHEIIKDNERIEQKIDDYIFKVANAVPKVEKIHQDAS